MTPSEHEVQVATEAAAKRQYEIERGERLANGAPKDVWPDWESLTAMRRHQWLDAVSMLVWAALQALPERAPEGDPRQKWRHLIIETNERDFTQLQQMHRLLKGDLVHGQT